MMDFLMSLITFFVLHEEPINGTSEYHMCFPGYGTWGMTGMWFFWTLFILIVAILLVLVALLATRR